MVSRPSWETKFGVQGCSEIICRDLSVEVPPSTSIVAFGPVGVQNVASEVEQITAMG